MKAIKISYLPATNTKGTRLKASIKDGMGNIKSLTVSRDYEMNDDEQVKKLAKQFIKDMDWDCKISGIGVYNEDYYITLK